MSYDAQSNDQLYAQFAQQLENAVASEGLTNGVPSKVRRRYQGIGVGIIVISIVGAIIVLIIARIIT